MPPSMTDSHPPKTRALTNYVTRVMTEGVWPRFHRSHDGDVEEGAFVTDSLHGSVDQDNVGILERRRKNQERYRSRQRKKLLDLVNDCWRLRHEIHWLKLQQGELSHVASAKDNPWVAAAQYFKVVLPNLLSPSGNSTGALNFLSSTLSPHVDTNALASHWRVFGFLIHGTEVRLQRLDQLSPNILVANTTTKITITSNTLHTAFPHLSSNSMDPDTRHVQIAATLRGQSFVLRGSVRFVWDSEHCKFVDLHSQADMISPLLQVLGNIEDVSIVFSEALIAPDCKVVVERIAPTIVHAAWAE